MRRILEIALLLLLFALVPYEYTHVHAQNIIGGGGPLQWQGVLQSGPVTAAMTVTTSTQVIAGVANNFLYITQCVTSNGSTTVSTDILLQNGNAGTTLYVLPAPAGSIGTTGNGGGTFPFPVPLKVPTAGNGLFAQNVTTGSATKISCSGWSSTQSY